ncbi:MULTISPECIES: hypothetical protein [unclassified Streptomyces]|uniref:hypothetical protein n=1 Tax=Streptomyces sp. NPDC093269 TaxID=3366038 RepID=UPI00382213CE
MRELSGAVAFDQLRAELARAAGLIAGDKPPRRKVAEEALRPPGAEPDDGHGEASRLGPG